MEIGNRPWGSYYVLEDTDFYKLKRIEVNPGQRLSYQFHHQRQEQWTIIEGDATIILDDNEIKLSYGESVFIPQGAKHRIMNLTEKPVIFGIVTTDNIEQAIERAGTKAGNKGFDAAMSAMEMMNLLKNI